MYIVTHTKQNVVNARLKAEKEKCNFLRARSVQKRYVRYLTWSQHLLKWPHFIRVRWPSVEGQGARVWFVSEAESWKQISLDSKPVFFFNVALCSPHRKGVCKNSEGRYIVGLCAFERASETRYKLSWVLRDFNVWEEGGINFEETAGTLMPQCFCSGRSLCMECFSLFLRCFYSPSPGGGLL